MKERWVTFLLALGALALFIAMFARTEGGINPKRETARPATSERRGNGYYAALTWLKNEGVRAIALREPLGALLQSADPESELRQLPASGNLLIVTLPAMSSYSPSEYVPLTRWIRSGNTLLVMATLIDNPDWARALGGLARSELTFLTGLEFDAAGGSASERMIMVPNREHVYFTDVNTAQAAFDYSHGAWDVKMPYDGFVLELARERETGRGALWTRALGDGRIVVSGMGSLFTNRALGLADNARLLANIVGANVAPNGAVLFDDLHQGVSAAYDPARFFKDRRLYATGVIVLMLWFAWVLGSTRLRSPAGRVPVPREAELVTATGEFFARKLPVHAGARALIEHFLTRVRAHLPQVHAALDPWEPLRKHPKIAHADLTQLEKWYADARSARRVPLRELHNLIVRIERQI